MAKHFDIVVVGAGILGAAAAFHLQKNSPRRRILLVDRFPSPGQGNTGRSNAMFRNTFTSLDNQVLSDSTIEYYLHLQEAMGADIGLQRIGYLWLMSGRQLSASEKALEGMARQGIEVQRLSKEDLRAKIPGMAASLAGDGQAKLMALPEVEGGAFGPKCGRLDPDKLVRHYVGGFLGMGGRVAFNTSAEKLLLGPDKRLGIEGEPFAWQDYRVEGIHAAGALNGEVATDTVVLACGAWGNELMGPAGLDGHVSAKKRQLFSVSAKGSKALEELMHAKGFNPLGVLPMTILPKGGVHFKPVAEEGDFWMGSEDEANRPFIHVPDRDLGAYLGEPEFYERSVNPVVSTYFPAFRNARAKAMWAGLYSYNTVDYIPFVFRQAGVITVGGDSGSGIMKGDALGRIVDAVYRGEEEALLYGGERYRTSKLGFESRDVEREEWVI